MKKRTDDELFSDPNNVLHIYEAVGNTPQDIKMHLALTHKRIAELHPDLVKRPVDFLF